MRNADPLVTAHYLEKSAHFFYAMKLAADDIRSYGTSIALLAVHSAISLNDAILVSLTGKKRSNSDHQVAATALDKACKQSKVEDRRGVAHLRWLLSNKSEIAYGTKRLDTGVLQMALDKAERFNSWAYNEFKGVLSVSSRIDTGTMGG